MTRMVLLCVAVMTMQPLVWGQASPRQHAVEVVRNHLDGAYGQRLSDPKEIGEHWRNFKKLSLVQPGALDTRDVTLKPPGSSAFVRWDRGGFVQYPQPAAVFGYFVQDTRFIRALMLRDENGLMPELSDVTLSGDGQRASYGYLLRSSNVAVERHETIRATDLQESFTFRNQDPERSHTVVITVHPDFADIFEVRSPEAKPLSQRPFKETAFALSENQADISVVTSHPGNPKRVSNTLRLRLSPLPDTSSTSDAVLWKIALRPNETKSLQLTFQPENALRQPRKLPVAVADELKLPVVTFRDSSPNQTRANRLNQVFSVSSRDLPLLTLAVPDPNDPHKVYAPPAAGIPNYVAFFGRDSIIASLFLLQFQPEYARQTLLALAAWQGAKEDAWTEEEPGKILHELRLGEMTRLGYTPHAPYYASLDATPLFVMLYDAYVRRTGDVALAADLKPNVERALAWLERNTSHPGKLDGFLTQRDLQQDAVGSTGLKNIGWKDSEYALRLTLGPDGKLHDPVYPVAPVEVQTYVREAWIAAARHFPEKALGYQRRAKRLGDAMQAFWMPDKHWPAIALDRDGQPVQAVASNGAYVWLSNVLTPAQNLLMRRRSLLPDLESGWGMRTLSADESAYNPIAYHNGTVWPHDTAMVVSGAKKQGFDDVAGQYANEILRAAASFPEKRLPELYAGLSRRAGEKELLEYPETCTIQAWASATPFSLLSSLLGLDIRVSAKNTSAPELKLIGKPALPTGIQSVEIKHLPITSHGFVTLYAKRHGKQVRVQLLDETSVKKVKANR